ncbi:MAG: alpha/beta fold hydrolase [Aggregatilineales bacterium]
MISRFRASLILIILVVSTLAFAQEQDATFTDAAGRFSVPIPANWTNRSTESIAHFTNPDATADIYASVVAAEDVQTGIQAALETFFGSFDASPVQISDAPLPDGTVWTQNIYALPDGSLVAAVGRLEDEWVHVIAIRAPQAALIAATPTLNTIVLGHRAGVLAGAAPELPAYIVPETFTEQAITIDNGDWSLPATLALPIGEGPFPAVVIVHGSGPIDRDGTLAQMKPYRDIAQGLASRGIAVLRYDKRTYAHQERMLEEMPADFTIDDEYTDDALAAVAALRGLESIDPERIFVAAHSQGGTLGPRIAARDPALAGLILLAAGARPFEVVVRDQVDYITRLDPAAAGSLSGLLALADALQAIRAGADPAEALGSDQQVAYWMSLLNYDPLATAAELRLPVLVLQGERDYQATMEDFALWRSALADHEDATFISYPTLNHTFTAVGDLDRLAIPSDYVLPAFVDVALIDDITAWIAAH